MAKNNDRRKLTDGMWDHGYVVQRPRYHRSCITCVFILIMLMQAPIFLTAMTSLIVQEVPPIFSRIAPSRSDNTTTYPGDAAVFFNKASGSVHLRLCPGALPVDCHSCNSGRGGGTYDDDYDYAVIGGDGDGDDSSVVIRQSKKRKGKHDHIQISSSSLSPPSSSVSSMNRKSRRRADDYQQEYVTECCGSYYAFWSRCPKLPVEELSKVFGDGASPTNNANCEKFLDSMWQIHAINTAWSVFGMVGTVVIAIPLLFKAYTLDVGAKTPLNGLLLISGVSLGLDGLCAGLQTALLVLNQEMFIRVGGESPNPMTEKTTCGAGTLYNQGFGDDNIFSIWQCALAGLSFCGFNAAITIIAYLYVYACSCSPSRPVNDDNRKPSQYSGRNFWLPPYFYDFENSAPAGSVEDNAARKRLRSGNNDDDDAELMQPMMNPMSML